MDVSHPRLQRKHKSLANVTLRGVGLARLVTIILIRSESFSFDILERFQVPLVLIYVRAGTYYLIQIPHVLPTSNFYRSSLHLFRCRVLTNYSSIAGSTWSNKLWSLHCYCRYQFTSWPGFVLTHCQHIYILLYTHKYVKSKFLLGFQQVGAESANCCNLGSKNKKPHNVKLWGFFHDNASSSIFKTFLLTFSKLSSNSTSFPSKTAIRSTYSPFRTGFSPFLLVYSLRL